MTSPFKRVGPDKPKTTTPEALFADLKGRDASIRGLLSQQADVLRSYSEGFVKEANVSLELPTGAGKTLIGLLVSEWRRRTFGERAIYLCPTVQLANQVATKAKLYGIEVVTFVGGKETFAPADVQDYNSGKKVAVAPYARIFNVSPGIAEPNFIVMDDAHAAEQYVAGMWSLSLDDDVPEARDAVLKIVSPHLPPAFVERLNEPTTSYRAQSLELLPVHAFDASRKSIREALDAALPDAKQKKRRNAFFRWEAIRNGLHACNVFVSAEEVLIRPYIPPSLTHRPFSHATQRLFLSATLGPTGSLERMVGIPRITRMPTPPLMQAGGTGRRFFLFPSAAIPQGEAIAWTLAIAAKQKRSLVVCRDHATRRAIGKTLAGLGVKILSADDVENSLEPFLSQTGCALVVASRFDGIDLPEDACRMTAIVGLPSAVNLQERFMLTRLGMGELLRDRVVTRFTQAAGRCTRGETDYSLVLPATQDLLDFASRRENRKAMHAVVAAEVGFGLRQSAGSKEDVLSAMTDLFFQQSPEWSEVDQEIAAYKEEQEAPLDESTQALVMANAAKEVEFGYALWGGPDLQHAADRARSITDAATGDRLRLYRAWWAYQTGTCYARLYADNKKPDFLALAEKFYAVARGAAGLASWYANLPHLSEQAQEPAGLTSAAQVERILEELQSLGLRGPRFEKHLQETRDWLSGPEAPTFERGLERLGRMLGFAAARPNTSGAPDGVWRHAGRPDVAFEAKTEKEAKNPISKADCTQAAGHRGWVKATHGTSGEHVEVAIVAANKTLHTTAKPHVDGLHHLDPALLLKEFDSIAEILRRVRNDCSELDTAEARLLLGASLEASHLRSEEIVKRLLAVPLGQIPVVQG